MVLNKEIESGRISQDQYFQFMNQQIEKDKKLLEFFQKNGLAKKAEIVKERIAIINQEIAE
jgi:hypothetical protein